MLIDPFKPKESLEDRVVKLEDIVERLTGAVGVYSMWFETNRVFLMDVTSKMQGLTPPPPDAACNQGTSKS